MRLRHVIGALVVCAALLATLAHAGPAKQRIQLKVILADGTQVRVTAVEGDAAEVERSGPQALHVALVPTYANDLVSVQIFRLGDKERRVLANVTGPVGESMEVWLGQKTKSPPTLRITPLRVY